MTSRASHGRLNFVFILILAAFLGLWCRLFSLQAVEAPRFQRMAAGQHTATVPIPAQRGKIYDRTGEILAISVPGTSVFVSPSEVENVEETASALAAALNVDAAELAGRIRARREKQFLWARRLVSEQEAAAVRSLRLEGVHLQGESRRLYPYGRLAAQAVGFTGVDEQGLGGVESAFDEYLHGSAGYRRERRDAMRRSISSPALEFVPARNGSHVVLTIETNIQDFLESAVEECWRRHAPESVTGIIMDPQNGDILALAQRPTYDPNYYADFPPEARRLRAVTDSFEPGSMFKPFVFSAALEEGRVALDDVIFCEHGAYSVGSRVLHDHHSYGELSALNVVVKSSNIGMAKIGQRLGPAAVYSYLRSFGFGRDTGLQFGQEAPGYLAPPEEWTRYTITSVPMGHEVSVTAVQMAAAFSAFANGGYLVKPRLVKGVLASDGRTVEKRFDPHIRRRVLGRETAATMLQNVLRKVVTEGTGRLADLEDYSIAGKTGTSQKLVDGRYSHSKYICSFICTGPVRDPRAVVLVVVDAPTKGPGRFGGSVAGPWAARALESTLDYLLAGRRRPGEGRYAEAGEVADAP